ncbi:MAG: multicopper oxidase domain-containing protein [Proteobacteria bacterium]|nr:multicopper oxidase domain-containing protein [Pseudomonadota bacterium]
MNKQQQKLIQRTMDVQRELTRSGLDRRNLMKLGVLSAGTGMLLPIQGLSMRAAYGASTPVCPIPGVDMISPRTTPFKDRFRRLEELNPTYTVKSSVSELTDAMMLRGGKPTHAPTNALDSKLRLLREHPELATATPFPNLAHQGWDGTDKNTGLLNPPKDIYEMRAVQHKHVWHSEMPAGAAGQDAWGFVDKTYDNKIVTGTDGSACTGIGGVLFRLKYGRSHLTRIYNELPTAAQDAVSALGFGTATMSTHMHNGHTPSESDGGPLYYNYSGGFWDHHYPNLYAGINQGFVSPKAGVRGDYREALGSLWYHDHKHDFTSQNVYAGLFGACPIYDEVDTGDETVVGTTGIRFPSHSQDAASYPYEFDVPMFFHDRQFDPQGVDFFPLACQDGAIGDKLTVNGTIQPYFKVQPRKYRIRMYNGGPSRFYWWWLRQGAAGSTYLPMTVIANDGNLLPRAVDVTSFKQGVAERFDLIIDFSKFKPGTELFISNRGEQTNGRGPTGKLLTTGQDALKFIVEAARPGLTDNSTKIVNGMALRPLPAAVVLTGAKTKEWVWGRGNGAWNANGVTFDRYAAPYEVKEGSSEVWVHKNGGGSWSHPLHVHYEEGRILSYNGAAQPDPTKPLEGGRKDVYRIDPSATITTAMRFRDYKGIYPMHCHNVVHEDHGMMAMWKIV